MLSILTALSLLVPVENPPVIVHRRLGTVATATAVRAQRSPIIDGKDDDAVWTSAQPQSEFREFDPREDGAPRFRTEFKIAYDNANLYVFIRAFDPHPDSIMHALSRRDVRGSADQLKVIIDSYDDHRSGYEFAVNPDGVKRDYAMYSDGNEDDSWNGVWEAATAVDSLGWTAEFRIPFSQLRYADTPVHTFGFGVWRDIERFKERVSWPVYRQSRNGLSSQLGEVVGISGIAAPRHFEATPYSSAKNSPRVTNNGFGRLQRGTMGADLKYGITPNMTLDATVNPDFGQVESDPAVLNLGAFETFLQERRPFFVEGTGLYQFGQNCSIVNCSGEGLFYSRRIGRAPQLLGQYGDASSPTATPILGASKLTGRTGGGFSFGVLDALTDRVEGLDHQAIEPRTNYAVVRATQDLNGGQSGIGFITTAVNRSLDAGSTDLLRRSAYVAATDFRHRFGGGNYEMTGSVTATHVTGSPAAILQTQLDPVHEYQRPDGALRLDSARTSLDGNSEEFLFGKLGGGVTRFQTSFLRQSAGYEINDLGFLLRADEQSWNTWGSLQFRTPKWFYKSVQINVNEWNTWTTSGLTLEHAFNTNWHVALKSNWWVNAGATLAQVGGAFCDRCTRGGPAIRRSAQLYPWFGISGDDRMRFVPYLWVNLWRGDDGRSHSFNTNPNFDFKMGTQLVGNLGVSYTHNVDNTQWFGNVSDASRVMHYTFAHLDQKTLSLSARASYTITPNLTVEEYAQPFVSTGSYSNLRQVSATPGAVSYDARFAPFTPPVGPPLSTGFDFRQLASNSVVRWEYRPGSTLFLVWTQGRQGGAAMDQRRSMGDEYHDLFAAHPDNTFLIKVAYWLNR